MGITDVSPAVAAPALTNYELCATFTGPVATGASQRLECDVTGRYLVVQLEGSNKRLTMCEVEVYERKSYIYRYNIVYVV